MLNKRSNGLTLIEALVAMVIISIGLLGMMQLQFLSIRHTSTSLQHSQAVWLGYDLADRIRVNGAAFGSYAGIDTSTNQSSQDCMASACTAEQMVSADAADWSTQVRSLPAGRGMVVGDASELELLVMWDDESTGATGTDCGGDPEVDLTCYSITLYP